MVGRLFQTLEANPSALNITGLAILIDITWIVILKAIVQGFTISDSLVAAPDRMQGHEELCTSATWATSITDRLPFSEILQAVIEGQDTREYQVLATIYPSMITAHDLLSEVEWLLAQARERSKRRVVNGVFNFMRVWVLSGHLEEPLLSEMRRFPDVRIKNLIDRPRKRKPKKVLKNIASIGSQEIVDLSQALCNLEFEDCTLQSAIQTLATWRDHQQITLFLPFAVKVSSSLWFLTPQYS